MANFKGVRYEHIRRKVDPKYLSLVSKLEECFYGEEDSNGRRVRVNCWMDDTSKPFSMGGVEYDVQPTTEESRDLFNKLHGLIWKQHAIELHDENQKLPLPPAHLKDDEKAVAEKLGFYMDKGVKKTCRASEEYYNMDMEGNKKDVKYRQEIESSGITISIPQISKTEGARFIKD